MKRARTESNKAGASVIGSGQGSCTAKKDFVGFGFVDGFAATLDFGVESGEAEAETLGFGFAGAIVVGGRKRGEGGERGFLDRWIFGWFRTD